MKTEIDPTFGSKTVTYTLKIDTLNSNVNGLSTILTFSHPLDFDSITESLSQAKSLQPTSSSSQLAVELEYTIGEDSQLYALTLTIGADDQVPCLIDSRCNYCDSTG